MAGGELSAVFKGLAEDADPAVGAADDDAVRLGAAEATGVDPRQIIDLENQPGFPLKTAAPSTRGHWSSTSRSTPASPSR
jgi:hypothetical protein